MHIHDTHGRMCKRGQRQKTFFKNLALMGQPHSPLKNQMGRFNGPMSFAPEFYLWPDMGKICGHTLALGTTGFDTHCGQNWPDIF